EQFAHGFKARSEPSLPITFRNRKHDGDASLVLRDEARRPVQERQACARRHVVKLMSLIAESDVAAVGYVDRSRALATPFGGHGATGVTAQRYAVYMRVDEGRASLNTMCIDFELRTS